MKRPNGSPSKADADGEMKERAKGGGHSETMEEVSVESRKVQEMRKIINNFPLEQEDPDYDKELVR